MGTLIENLLLLFCCVTLFTALATRLIADYSIYYLVRIISFQGFGTALVVTGVFFHKCS